MQSELEQLHCMTTANISGHRMEVVGSCLYSFSAYLERMHYPLPCNISQLNDFTGSACEMGRQGGIPHQRCLLSFTTVQYGNYQHCPSQMVPIVRHSIAVLANHHHTTCHINPRQSKTIRTASFPCCHYSATQHTVSLSS